MNVLCALHTDGALSLLQECDVRAFTEVNETVGYGETGPAEGLAFYPGTNSVILTARDDEHVARVGKVVQDWYRRHAEHPGWEKPAVRVFAMPCVQIA